MLKDMPILMEEMKEEVVGKLPAPDDLMVVVEDKSLIMGHPSSRR